MEWKNYCRFLVENDMLNSVTVIIPAYKPGHELLDTIDGLNKAGFADILVVDDGSGEAFAKLFEEVRNIPECTLLRHDVNRGKGAALKTAFSYYLQNRKNAVGVVTADADGQHLPCDIRAVAERMAACQNTVLGVRDFSDPAVPPRSKSGNRITRAMFRIFLGMRITDTQTGLRAFPTHALPVIASAAGDRYEFETNMLFLMNQCGLSMEEVKISTVYIDDNSSSHFRVVRDSLRIYALFIKYLFSFLLSAVLFCLLSSVFVDAGIWQVFPLPEMLSSGIAGGVVASLVHYFINAAAVFDSSIRVRTFGKYLLLAAAQVILTAVLFYLIQGLPAVLYVLIKSIAWVLFFFIHFRLQHKWAFRPVV